MDRTSRKFRINNVKGIFCFMKEFKKAFSEEQVNHLANRFKVLSEPTRLKIISCIHLKEKSVSQITKEIDSYQSNVSKQLQLLLDDEIVSCKVVGAKHLYKLTDKTIINICKKLCKSLGPDSLEIYE